MTYTALDKFYLTDEELHNSPSRNNGMDDATETTLRNYGCELIQVSCILLKLPQAAMATAQILFHRFYCKKSFKFFNVKKVAASCVWLASKLEECPKKARQVVIVFHRIERRKENLPIEHLDPLVKELKMEELNRIERHVLKELGFIGHAEHPHKLISSYLAALETPPKLGQQAWSLANDSLRTTLCVRFKSEVVACGVVYAAARRFRVPLPENPPWWEAFDANKAGIDEVCRVLAHLYSLPKARYIPVCKRWTSQIRRKFIRACPSREREALYIKSESERCKTKDREIDKDKDSRDREEAERDRSHRTNDRGHRSRDNRAKNHPYSEKSRHYSSRDRHNYHRSSYSSREKDRNRHHPPMPK